VPQADWVSFAGVSAANEKNGDFLCDLSALSEASGQAGSEKILLSIKYVTILMNQCN